MCVVSKEGIFQKGTADDNGKFTFKKPLKSSFVFAAAPEHESEKISYSDQPTVKMAGNSHGHIGRRRCYSSGSQLDCCRF